MLLQGVLVVPQRKAQVLRPALVALQSSWSSAGQVLHNPYTEDLKVACEIMFA